MNTATLSQIGSLVLLILRFDGSLRPPRDPGFPTEKLSRLASSAAAIIRDDSSIIAVGGKTIPLYPGITSADVEFEGLLMGLDYLSTEFKENERRDEVLTIEGDCKAVIDQMNGIAKARKLATKYQAANSFRKQLGFTEINFCHIPRRMNTLCDSVCEEVINLLVDRNFRQLRNDLQESRFSIDKIINVYFGDCSIIPYSRRLLAYMEALKSARLLEDGFGIQRLGEQLQQDAKAWPDHGGNYTKTSEQSLTSLALRLQIEGLNLQGETKNAFKLRRKHRFIHQQPWVAEKDLLGGNKAHLENSCDGRLETLQHSNLVNEWKQCVCEELTRDIERKVWINL